MQFNDLCAHLNTERKNMKTLTISQRLCSLLLVEDILELYSSYLKSVLVNPDKMRISAWNGVKYFNKQLMRGYQTYLRYSL